LFKGKVILGKAVDLGVLPKKSTIAAIPKGKTRDFIRRPISVYGLLLVCKHSVFDL